MSKFIKALIFLSLFLPACTGKVKLAPEYPGEDPRVIDIVKEYKELATKQGFYFTKQVTIGFSDIQSATVIAFCTFGKGWREIDIDKDFWDRSDYFARKMVVFHELTHCYCDRDHDYGLDKPYVKSKKTLENGYFDDGCAITIMHPVQLFDSCYLAHYDHYVKEMFDRCVTW